MKTEKIWGQTEVLLQSSFVELHRLFILPRSRCSMHVHNYKWNAFIVISGYLVIEALDEGDEKCISSRELESGEYTTIKPGVYHRFVSGDAPVIALEFYYPEPLSEDIFRRDVGSRDVEA